MPIAPEAGATVKGITVNGGGLVTQGTQDIALASDWILVIIGDLF